jgi:hypothetical protein
MVADAVNVKSRKPTLAEESANFSANLLVWQGCHLIFVTFFTDFFNFLWVGNPAEPTN